MSLIESTRGGLRDGLSLNKPFQRPVKVSPVCPPKQHWRWIWTLISSHIIVVFKERERLMNEVMSKPPLIECLDYGYWMSLKWAQWEVSSSQAKTIHRQRGPFVRLPEILIKSPMDNIWRTHAFLKVAFCQCKDWTFSLSRRSPQTNHHRQGKQARKHTSLSHANE